MNIRNDDKITTPFEVQASACDALMTQTEVCTPMLRFWVYLKFVFCDL